MTRERRSCAIRLTIPAPCPSVLIVQTIVFIVARHRHELFEALKQAFAGEPNVSVVLDQRVDHRRRQPGATPSGKERRRFDRRERHVSDVELRERGWTMIQLRV